MKRLVLAVALAAACSTSPSSDVESITVLAASSLTASFTRLGADFEAAHPGTHVTFSFAASSALAQQLLAGAPADVFAAASAKSMHQVADLTSRAKPFARNVAEIAVAPGTSVTTLADLARPGLKVALCEVAVPCGEVAEQVLTKAHLRVRPVTRGLDVKGTLGYVLNGSADAAIVYSTDVRAAGNRVHGIEIPSSLNAGTDYQIATLAESGHQALARAFEHFVLSSQGQATLAHAGFLPP
ncbi:MAG: molybdate ABC transporter substrate-binding protein [Mycobacteriales bacterium]